ncbi:uncharacterized protein B0H64DRAFT_388909 [Chaetomium fimeti]|uniref:DUF1993 domain-containing protein n=1 Tax=Chaetomium fimeti TaxID=1854472 RepID=A0AAE0HN28_9PEZI|nr:hypothetical protein B0H64DRAFT_388909 [Chaetomium fimeti]
MTTPVNAYDIGIATPLRGLLSLQNILAKAAAHPSAATLAMAKLHGCEDMKPFAFHVQSCVSIARGTPDRLVPATQPVETEQAGVDLDEENVTLEKLGVLVQGVVGLLQGVREGEMEGAEGKRVVLRYGGEHTFVWQGRGYILGYGLPNFMFHLCMAYSILRSQGVDVGKMDYIGPFMDGMTVQE